MPVPPLVSKGQKRGESPRSETSTEGPRPRHGQDKVVTSKSPSVPEVVVTVGNVYPVTAPDEKSLERGVRKGGVGDGQHKNL